MPCCYLCCAVTVISRPCGQRNAWSGAAVARRTLTGTYDKSQAKNFFKNGGGVFNLLVHFKFSGLLG